MLLNHIESVPFRRITNPLISICIIICCGDSWLFGATVYIADCDELGFRCSSVSPGIYPAIFV